jgi:hypothetical protein
LWKDEQKRKSGFRRKHYSRAWVLDLGYEPLKVYRKSGFPLLFLLPKSSFGEHNIAKMGLQNTPNVNMRDALTTVGRFLCNNMYAPQTKMLEVRTNIPTRLWCRRSLQVCEYSIWATNRLKSASIANEDFRRQPARSQEHALIWHSKSWLRNSCNVAPSGNLPPITLLKQMS